MGTRRRAIAHDRNFPRTGEHRTIRPSVARVLLARDFDSPDLPDRPSDAELWEAERAIEDADHLKWVGFDPRYDCCPECLHPELQDLARTSREVIDAYFS